MNGNITFAWIISVLVVPLGAWRGGWWAMVTQTPSIGLHSCMELRLWLSNFLNGIMEDYAGIALAAAVCNFIHLILQGFGKTQQSQYYWGVNFYWIIWRPILSSLLQKKNHTSAQHCGSLQSIKPASLFRSPHFLSLSVCVYIHWGGWRANQFSLGSKRPGLRLQPSAQANITLCLLAPPTPPPHICLRLEIFSSFYMGVVLKKYKK